jgi:2-methylisocitrate lyase-like PEP mutase family enzyme
MPSPADRLRALIDATGLLVMPCCFDAFSAKLIERAGFRLTFMSGFAVSATRLGLPDTGLISYGEMLDQGRNICAAVSIPVIGDADTGYDNDGKHGRGAAPPCWFRSGSSSWATGSPPIRSRCCPRPRAP